MNYQYKLYGAILGDLAGQPYEFPAMKGPYTNINLYNPNNHVTDDTLMTLASASYLLGNFNTIEEAYKDMGNRYQGDYYGKGFKAWLKTPLGTINNSWANGCLMKASPFMYIKDRQKSRELLIESCLATHNHPQSILACIDLFQIYQISTYIARNIKFDHVFPIFDKFDVTAKGTVEFINKIKFGSYSTHLAIEKTIKSKGDTDTNASIIGELTNFMYQDITKEDIEYIENKLDSYQLKILHEFNQKF